MRLTSVNAAHQIIFEKLLARSGFKYSTKKSRTSR
jgi:hypothetical protein